MRTKLLLTGALLGSAMLLSSQTTINIKISAALDDHEERISGALPQQGTLGDMIVASPTLELGNETSTTNPQLVGLRFINVPLPKFATIMDAYIQFTVKGTSKLTDPCALEVRAENSGNAAAFTNNPMSLSSRSTVSGFISWNVSGSSWSTVGSATADQRTSNLKTLIQPIMFNSGWNPGNALAFFIKGSGTREVVAYEDDPTKAAELVVTYSVNATGINELSKGAPVMVYPNPFKNAFNVITDLAGPSDVTISVLDLTGKLVEQKVVKQAAAGAFNYTSSTPLQAGIYFVKVQTNEKQEIFKMIAE